MKKSWQQRLKEQEESSNVCALSKQILLYIDLSIAKRYGKWLKVIEFRIICVVSIDIIRRKWKLLNQSRRNERLSLTFGI